MSKRYPLSSATKFYRSFTARYPWVGAMIAKDGVSETIDSDDEDAARLIMLKNLKEECGEEIKELRLSLDEINRRYEPKINELYASAFNAIKACRLWRRCKQVYRFDRALGKEILEATKVDPSMKMPLDLIRRIPYPILYFENPAWTFTYMGRKMDGVLVWIDRAKDQGCEQLSFGAVLEGDRYDG